jgi:L-idonate 5-dehydrogenase
MKAIVCHAPKDLRIDEMPDEPLGAKQMKVRVAFGGICGSDLHYFQHGGFGTIRIQHPMVLGHEVSGVVSGVGADVQGFKAGQKIAISPSRPCGLCMYCQKGQHNHCLDMRFYGSAMRMPHVHGAFADEIVIDASQAHALDANVDLSLAALAEPLSVGLHAISRAGTVFGKRVLVTGCGPIGVLLIAALRRAGAAQIVAVDLSSNALKTAKEMGADVLLNPSTDPDALKTYAANKGYFDVWFEASGNAAALRSGLDVIAPRGVIVTVGLGGEVTLPLNALVAKELELRGTFRFHEEFATAVRFLNQGLVNAKPVISHVINMKDAVSAFEIAGQRDQAMKVQIRFNAELAV